MKKIFFIIAILNCLSLINAAEHNPTQIASQNPPTQTALYYASKYCKNLPVAEKKMWFLFNTLTPIQDIAKELKSISYTEKELSEIDKENQRVHEQILSIIKTNMTLQQNEQITAIIKSLENKREQKLAWIDSLYQKTCKVIYELYKILAENCDVTHNPALQQKKESPAKYDHSTFCQVLTNSTKQPLKGLLHKKNNPFKFNGKNSAQSKLKNVYDGYHFDSQTHTKDPINCNVNPKNIFSASLRNKEIKDNYDLFSPYKELINESVWYRK
ncbi:MAG: hypothetical protein ACOYT8_00340 [Candidatus Dependentiae bacterium]